VVSFLLFSIFKFEKKFIRNRFAQVNKSKKVFRFTIIDFVRAFSFADL